MIITETALKLTKRYAAGAPCKVDFDNIKSTMFWPHYKKLAQEAGCNEIQREIVEKYWLKLHNRIVLELFFKRKYNLKDASNCLVYPGIVRKISEEKLTIAHRPFCLNREKKPDLSMGETIKEIDKQSLEVEEKTIISFHGKAAVDIISEEQAELLTRNMKEIIESLTKGSE